jgi:hypothetical protein
MRVKRNNIFKGPFWPIFLATIIFGSGLFILLNNVKPASSEQIFNEALSNQMQSDSIYRSKVIEQGKTVQSQVTQVQFGGENGPVSRDVVKISNTANGQKSSVETEGVGTKDADYIRYVSLETNGNKSDSKILGKWASNQGTEEQSAQFLDNAVFGSPVISGVSNAQVRKELMQQIIDTGSFKIEKVDTNVTVNGQKVYKYTAKINLKTYIPIFQKYLESVGMKEAASKLSAPRQDSYLPITLFVDPTTKTIIKAENSEGGATAEEYYTKTQYIVPPTVPKVGISVNELQEGLSSQ